MVKMVKVRTVLLFFSYTIYIILLLKKEIFAIISQKYNICYYTVFIGTESNGANHIPRIPSEHHDCYFFTNNYITYGKLKNTKWKAIFLDLEKSNNEIQSAMDAKRLKACPHLYKELKIYRFTIYFDSKLNLNCEKDIEKLIKNGLKKTPFILRRHPFVYNVWGEFRESMLQNRYAMEKEKYIKYINKNLKAGLKNTTKIHFMTGFIVRDNKRPIVLKINDTWYKHILECGIQCQISFSFVQQLYSDYIGALEFNI